jgi:dipeptidyl aminopeptidase/acylaminoacyl peptidase
MYAPPGYVLFVRDQTLMAQAFDASSGQTAGDAIPIAEQIDYDGLNNQAAFSVSQTGALAYLAGGRGGQTQLTWFDRSGKAVGALALGPPGDILWPAISPDGNTVAYDRRDPQSGRFDIWLHDVARGTDSRFGSNEQFPEWSPNGDRLAFRSVRIPGPDQIFERGLISTAQEQPLDQMRGVGIQPDDWSRDGRYLVETVIDTKTGNDLWVLPTFGDKKPFPYLRTEFNEEFARVSRDGQFLAYQSNESGRTEVYAQTFPVPGAKWPISSGGGFRPVWSRDGRELFFMSSNLRDMMAVAVRNNGGKLEAGIPKMLFTASLAFASAGNARYDVAPDGRFLIPAIAEQSAAAPMTVVVNWPLGVKK